MIYIVGHNDSRWNFLIAFLTGTIFQFGFIGMENYFLYEKNWIMMLRITEQMIGYIIFISLFWMVSMHGLILFVAQIFLIISEIIYFNQKY